MPGSRSSFIDLGQFSAAGGVGGAASVYGGAIAGDTQGKTLRWIDDFGDELAVAIAVRNWDESVGLVEKGESSSSPPSLVASC